MSNITLMLVLTGLVVVSGLFLTAGWQKYLLHRRQKKHLEHK